MSNKAVDTIYAKAMQRQKQEAIRQPLPLPKRSQNDKSERVRKHVPKHAATSANTRASIYKCVHKTVASRSRLGGSTFRFQGEELDRLDDLVEKVNKNKTLKVSKNDVVRIALNWMLEDHDANKRASMLSNVLARLRG